MAAERTRTAHALTCSLAVALALAALLWPALWNGYPIVFADTGTYLSQAVHRYLGWDRPPFYSLAILPLHLTLSLWPVVVAQALVTLWVLGLTWRVLCPGPKGPRMVAWPKGPGMVFWPVAPRMAVAGLILAGATWLPWLVSEVMPDLFTALLVLATALLGFAPALLTRCQRRVLTGLAAFMIAAQTSNLALFAILAVAAVAVARPRLATALRLVLPPALALAALVAVNLAGHGRASPAPFGALFLLARLVDDGPAVAVLRRACPDAGWALCSQLGRLPMNSDDFLWAADGPVRAAGGHKALAAEAGAIVRATLRQQPGPVLRGAVANTLAQLRQFASGDGLQAWPGQVSPWIEADFSRPAQAAYAAARQQNGGLAVPGWLALAHQVAALGGVALCLLLLARTPRLGMPAAGVLALVLLALPVSAAVTGALSGPHDRYQARVMWLPLFAGLACLAERRG